MDKLRGQSYWQEYEAVASIKETVLVREAESRAKQHAEIDRYEQRLYAVADKIDPIVATVNSLGLGCSWHIAVLRFGVEISCWLDKPIGAWVELLPLFEAFDAAGLADVTKWRNEDLAESYTRMFRVPIVPNEKDPSNFPQLELRVYANLPGDTEGCKRVVKGFTEGYVSKPEPIYAFECSPESELPNQPQGENHGIEA